MKHRIPMRQVRDVEPGEEQHPEGFAAGAGSAIDFAADAAAVAAQAPADAIRTIGELAEQAVTLEEQIVQVEQSLKLLQTQERTLLEVTLPEAMDAANVKTFTTTDGRKLEVGPFLQVSLAGDKLGQACAWLRETGNDGLITRDILVPFKKGQGTEAEALISKLKTDGYGFTDKSSVNTASFKALLRELIQQGQPVPLDRVGAYAARRVSIKKAK
jgi:hypothetical protein